MTGATRGWASHAGEKGERDCDLLALAAWRRREPEYGSDEPD
jgi:hypothetical protein